MKKICLIVFAVFCVSSLCAQVKGFDWLVGTWQEKDNPNFEVWQMVGDKLRAESFELKSDEIKTVTEKIRLIKKGSDFFYIPDVPHNAKPIEFKITSFHKNGFVAENPQHDFPKKISYKKINETELQATISGGNKSISYLFQKIK
ncbi:MAG: DUF6265 family protein [Flammeovirgaceae bacterium]